MKEFWELRPQKNTTSMTTKSGKKPKKNIEWRKIVLVDKFDIVDTWQGDILCSERLKQAIEENGITGFEFFDIDYEVVAE